jgi:uncharacterized protein
VGVKIAYRVLREHRASQRTRCDDVATMLELRPSCEHCNRPLPPSSTEARICSFECTFCAGCVERVLGNVCPNCGANCGRAFERRPIRPALDRKGGNYLGAYPPSMKVTYRPIDPEAQRVLREAVGHLAPESR